MQVQLTQSNENNAYVERRNHLLNTFEDGVIIIPTGSELIRNQDSTYPFRFESNFYYLTGFTEPDAVLVLDLNNRKSILFCREKNPEREIWDGFRYGVDGAKQEFAFDETYPIKEFADKLPELLTDIGCLYYALGNMPIYDDIIIDTLKNIRSLFRRGVSAPRNIVDINQYIAEMRLIKDAHDIKYITRACEISADAHVEAMKYVKNATYEYEIEAKILEVFYKNGSRYPAYTTIAGGGKNGCILHYIANNAKLNPQELILVDAGCEYHGYAGDITRTYPIGGKFSRAQQAVYEIVLEANKQAVNQVRLNNPWNVPRDTATKILTQGLIDLGLLQGSLEDNLQQEKYKQFYMHGIGHWLGLDVHDVGSYKSHGEWRPYKIGMCTTIEPGLYISPAANVPEEYWNIGIRIEDNILLTAKGATNLTHSVPKEVAEIEDLINS